MVYTLLTIWSNEQDVVIRKTQRSLRENDRRLIVLILGITVVVNNLQNITLNFRNCDTKLF